MDLVAYVRVSTGKQGDAYGPAAQLSAMRKWAKSNGHRIVAECTDTVSGTTQPSERPGLTEALDALRPPPRARGLLVMQLDRLARALHIQESILAVAWATGATVFTASDGEVLQDDPDDPYRTFVRQVMGGAAQLERALVVKRMRAGREAKRAAGKHSVGPYAFGYHGDGVGRDRDAAPLSDEQGTVERIVELRKAGRSYREITATLDAEGLRPRKAAAWSAMSVRNIAMREMSAG
jgi:DNA invertase Pin-like site-specific DNA recombinase